MQLYRPAGLEELLMIYESGMQRFPLRLSDQPFFYPVLNKQYADQIAGAWNTNSGSKAGYVTQFAVDDSYVQQFDVRKVGGADHLELWIPAAQVEEFNARILSRICVINAFFGEGFTGFIPTKFGLKGKNAVMQLVGLAGAFDHSRMDFHHEILFNHTAVFLHYPFWSGFDFREHGIDVVARDLVLSGVSDLWATKFPEIPLPKVIQ